VSAATEALPLFGQPDAIEAQYEEFHAEHPEVFEWLVDMARKAKARGHGRYGIAGLFESLRWHRMIEKGDREFKLNNNLRAIYARRIMEAYPELDGFFETRTRRAS